MELRFSLESLPNSSMKVLSLLVPWKGTLVLSVSSRSGQPFNAYMVHVTGRANCLKSNELPLVEAFTAEGVRTYRRSAPVEQGEYHLNLVNPAPKSDPHEPSLLVYARLDR